MEAPLILTVSQLNSYTRSLLDGDTHLNNVFVSGEISNFVNHYRSGHLYMTLKDNGASIKAVMFAGNASKLKFTPENGMSVIVRGRVSIYERDGQYQLYIDDMQPDGVGALTLAFEQRKEKLAKAGLFDAQHKKQLPRFPSKIGVISSPTGAAVQDVLNVLQRRFPAAEIVFAGVQVQGDSAAPQICDAIYKFNSLSAADVIIIARGGGSAEDLWQFNDEKLAYAIYESEIPIISGVGHETDFTICDFVADMRAPTPSAAAELAVPDLSEQIYYISSLKNTIYSLTVEFIHNAERELEFIEKSSVLANPLSVVDSCELYLDSVWNKINTLFSDKVNTLSTRFSSVCSSLDALSPIKVLARGYSIIHSDDGIISSSKNLVEGEKIDIDFSDGKAKAVITEVQI